MTSFSGIVNFLHSKDISTQNHFERMNNFSTQRLRGSENGNGESFSCYGNKTFAETAEKQRTTTIFAVLCFSAVSVVVTKKRFVVAVL